LLLRRYDFLLNLGIMNYAVQIREFDKVIFEFLKCNDAHYLRIGLVTSVRVSNANCVFVVL
jgi:hypothetical protein